ncbi:MAG: hypothetical protein K2K88_07380 [Muribaculaceae bacterium]|nr:hypothetical protein [Muribaculaceae bacterium]
MKKLIFLLGVMSFLIFPSCNKDDPKPKISQIPSDMKIAFPDESFRNYVLANFDRDKNGVISEDEAIKVTEVQVRGKNIKSLEGIQYFPNLEILDCSYNQLTTLDVLKNTALTELQCQGNLLNSLDVSKNAALTELYCQGNRLTSLDVSGCTALTMLSCSLNQLATLDVSKNTALTELHCWDNKLTTLDVSWNTELNKLKCNMSSLMLLYVSKNAVIDGITKNRRTEYINSITEIVYE